jgi:hypothetical protein
MVVELAKLIDCFPGAANLTRCFLHIVNLVAKSTLHVFDPPKNKADDSSLDAAAKELNKLAANLEQEEAEAQMNLAARDSDDMTDNTIQEDIESSVEGWVDEVAALSENDRKELEASVIPVQTAILKVRSLTSSQQFYLAKTIWLQLRRFSYAIIHSSTLLLPRWFSLLRDLGLKERAMPRDVATRWNSTFDMLNFALEYKQAIVAMSGDLESNLRDYELKKEEWVIIEQLAEVLKVCVRIACLTTCCDTVCRSTNTPPCFSPVALRTSPLSSQPWITSTTSSLSRLSTMLPFFHPSALRVPFPRRPSIATMTRPMPRKPIALL